MTATNKKLRDACELALDLLVASEAQLWDDHGETFESLGWEAHQRAKQALMQALAEDTA